MAQLILTHPQEKSARKTHKNDHASKIDLFSLLVDPTCMFDMCDEVLWK
jgi:hypothetical protein